MVEPLTPPGAHRPRLRPLRWWLWVGLSTLVIAAAGVLVWWWLWLQAQELTGADLSRARTEAIRTGLTAAAGLGALCLALLAVRRQRSTEEALVLQNLDLEQKAQVAAHTKAHQDRVADDGRHDASERRITELYLKAADQLGSDKAPVRLAGLHALERLAQGNPDHRQTIVDLFCAYLRMPYDLPEPLQEPAAPEDRHERQRRDQERQVRLTAQRILAAHLRPDPDDQGNPREFRYWPGVVLDLSGATLIGFDLSYCHVDSARFEGARFAEPAWFSGATFTGVAEFSKAIFTKTVWFHAARFEQDARFTAAEFHGEAMFGDVKIDADAKFARAAFSGKAWFDRTEVGADGVFSGASFMAGARFRWTKFGRAIRLEGARVGTPSEVELPSGWTIRPPGDAPAGHLDTTEGEWSYIARESEAEHQSSPDPE